MNAIHEFNFTSGEIESNTSDPGKWHRFVRRREVEQVFSVLGKTRFPMALELGAGDGEQSRHLAVRCGQLISTEYHADGRGNRSTGDFPNGEIGCIRYAICDAQDLSQYEDCSFDLVFSSNMLEHLPDPLACLRECRRVIRPGGLVIHTMPTRAWKICGMAISALSGRLPGPHGAAPTHIEEIRRFGRKVWLGLFKEAGLTVFQEAGLPFYMGHGNRFKVLLKLGNRLKISGTWAFYACRPGYSSGGMND